MEHLEIKPPPRRINNSPPKYLSKKKYLVPLTQNSVQSPIGTQQRFIDDIQRHATTPGPGTYKIDFTNQLPCFSYQKAFKPFAPPYKEENDYSIRAAQIRSQLSTRTSSPLLYVKPRGLELKKSKYTYTSLKLSKFQ